MPAIQHSRSVHHHVGRDDSSGEFYNPVVTIFGLIALCLFIMAPMLWMLWQMRNSHHDRNIERQTRRTLYPTTMNRRPALQQRAAHGGARREAVVEQHDFQDVTDPINQKHTPSLARASKVRDTVGFSSQAIAVYSHSLWERTKTYFARVITPSRRHRRNNRGVSIELPIMKRPAWQKLASGSFTPSATLGELSGTASCGRTELKRDVYPAPALKERGTQTDEELLARPEPALTVGLAIG